MTDSPLMLIKVLLLVGLGIAFAWWQFADLAREKKRAEAQKKLSETAED
jgi:hypothetical protein